MDRNEPQSLHEIFGHEELRADLTRMLAQDRVPHGLLLYGQKGRGKRTLANAFARHRLARSGEDVQRSPAPVDLKVLEHTEGQRQIGIEAVRELRDWFHLTPLESEGRVAIILEAERLTVEGGNSLLKLLEEPPEGGLLILTASRREAVLQTLISRCIGLRVGPLSAAALSAFLKARGCTGPRAALAIQLADGSPGQAMNLAERFAQAEGLEPLERLLSRDAGEFLTTHHLSAKLKEDGAKLEIGRERLREWLAATVAILRLGLRAELGSERAQECLAGLPRGLAASATGRGPAATVRALEACLVARRDLDSNLGVDVVLWSLLPALRPA